MVRRLIGSEREVFQRKRRAVVYQSHVGLVRRTDRGELGNLPKVLEENEGDQLLFGDGDYITGRKTGVDNSGRLPEDLYSKPEEIHDVYKALQPIAPDFYSIAAAFGNVHGVYAPGNVKLTPTILGNDKKYIIEKEGITGQEKTGVLCLPRRVWLV